MNATNRQLQVTFNPIDAQQALKSAIPSMAGGFNVNTAAGDFSLHADDAKAVMVLVRELVERRAAGAVTATTAASTATYNHAYTLAFQIGGSVAEDGEDVTAGQMRDALRARVNELMENGAMLSAVGAPFDTFTE